MVDNRMDPRVKPEDDSVFVHCVIDDCIAIINPCKKHMTKSGEPR